jgi:hypothetical protein
VVRSTTLVAILAVLGSCRTPTKVTLVLTTDAACVDVRGVSIAVGAPEAVEAAPPTTTTDRCEPVGDIGTLVIVPSGGTEAKFAVRVVAGIGKSPEACVADGYQGGCIVARRIMNFVPHTELTLPVPLTVDCLDVACDETHTCLNGQCVPAEILDPSQCEGELGCFLVPIGVGPGGGGPGGGGGQGGSGGAGGDGGGGSGGCSATTADCDAQPGCETDLQTSPDHCGSCDHGCLGGECAGGDCQPVVLATSAGAPRHLTVDDTHLYWATSGPTGQIWQVPLDGLGSATQLAGAQPMPGSIVYDGASQSLYWTTSANNGDVLRMALPGGRPQAIASGTKPNWLAVAGPNVFFTEATGSGEVSMAPIDGTGPTTTLLSGVVWPWSIAVDGTSVYVGTNASNGSIFFMPRQGGSSMQLAPAKFNYAIAFDATYLYFTEDTGIGRVPKAGGTATVLAATNFPYALALDATHVYWTVYEDGLVLRMPKAGGTVTTLATGQMNVWGIAVDDAAVYWANNFAGGQLAKVAKPAP